MSQTQAGEPSDAVKAFAKDYADLRVLSIGVGIYPEPKHWIKPKYMTGWLAKACLGFTGLQLLQKTLNVNTISMEQLRFILFNDIQTVRINAQPTNKLPSMQRIRARELIPITTSRSMSGSHCEPNSAIA